MVMTAARGINQPTIGIVGHSQAGKSTFLAVLLKAFQQRGYRVTPENPENGAYRDLLENHVSLGFFPPKTPVDNEENRISLRISHESLQRRGTDGIVLDFFDPAGDVFERDPGADNSEDERTRNLNTRNLILKRLEQCTGLIVVMDIHASPELLSQVFRTTVEDLCGRLRRAGNKDRISEKGLTMPVVILFTKADSLAWQQRHRVRNAEDWIREQPRFRDLVSVASTYCSRVYFAFCSAAGWRDGRPNLRTLVRPRPLPGRAASDGADKLNEAAAAALADAERHLEEYQGEHIPDPALSPDGIRHAAVATHDTSRCAADAPGPLRGVPGVMLTKA